MNLRLITISTALAFLTAFANRLYLFDFNYAKEFPRQWFWFLDAILTTLIPSIFFFILFLKQK